MDLSARKKAWLATQIKKLSQKGYSKAKIARDLNMLPQSLNNILNGNRGISDSFVDAFQSKYNIIHYELECLADRLSEIIIDLNSDLSSIADSFGLTAVELANFTNNFEWPSIPFDFVKFLKEYPEYSYQWILTGLDPKFNGDEEQCSTAVKQRAYEKAHPEFFPNKVQQTVKPEESAQLWKQIAFQNEQLKEKDSQINQLLNILQDKTH